MKNSIPNLIEKCENTLSLWGYEYSGVDSKQYSELKKILQILTAIKDLKIVDRIEKQIIKKNELDEKWREKQKRDIAKLVAEGKIPF